MVAVVKGVAVAVRAAVVVVMMVVVVGAVAGQYSIEVRVMLWLDSSYCPHAC